ncbi:MAG: hypothetical protein V4584_16085, partial [Verrucomicrobiota bacterium]
GPIDNPREKPKTLRETQSGRLVLSRRAEIITDSGGGQSVFETFFWGRSTRLMGSISVVDRTPENPSLAYES